MWSPDTLVSQQNCRASMVWWLGGQCGATAPLCNRPFLTLMHVVIIRFDSVSTWSAVISKLSVVSQFTSHGWLLHPRWFYWWQTLTYRVDIAVILDVKSCHQPVMVGVHMFEIVSKLGSANWAVYVWLTGEWLTNLVRHESWSFFLLDSLDMCSLIAWVVGCVESYLLRGEEEGHGSWTGCPIALCVESMDWELVQLIVELKPMTLLVFCLRVCDDEAGHLSLAMLAGMVSVEAMPLMPFQWRRVMNVDNFLEVLR